MAEQLEPIAEVTENSNATWVEASCVDGDLEEDDAVDDGGQQNDTEEEEEVADPDHEGRAAADAAVENSAGLYNETDVNDQVFEELVLHPDIVQEVQDAWAVFLEATETAESAADALYSAFFDASVNLQSLFKTPRAVLSMKILWGLHDIVASLHEPRRTFIAAESLGFQHLQVEITPPRVALFREALVDLFVSELGARCPKRALVGFRVLLNYLGGAFIYLRTRFADRLKILSSSWVAANRRGLRCDEVEGGGSSPEVTFEAASGSNWGTMRPGAGATQESRAPANVKAAKAKQNRTMQSFDAKHCTETGRHGDRGFSVPTSFQDMFMFNAAVMGFGDQVWMSDVLASFDAIVCNIANTYRLQEECDVLSLRLSKCRGRIYLADFKAVMLASLRSLVPRSWDSDHEVAWEWLWGNVERLLKAQLGKPSRFEKALGHFLKELDGDDHNCLRREVYDKFFELAPAGMDHFRQSVTRMHFIADKVVALTWELYRRPDKVVQDLSALGLRHVGYAIPTELFGPFVSSFVYVVGRLASNDLSIEAFRWSLSLISRVLTRVIKEGSTLVMRAINADSAKLLYSAVACAPRGDRAQWVLNNTVGTQSISPLIWSIESGAFNTAEAILRDLLTIRADRERYYFGVDHLFERHPDIICRLCMDAPKLLCVFFDGLIWRSRVTVRGWRRVNYFAKHLIVDPDGSFASAIEVISDHQDPKLACHPLVSYIVDLVWGRVAARAFLHRKSWLMWTMTVYTISQAVLNSGLHTEVSPYLAKRATVFAFRGFIYLCSAPSLVAVQLKQCLQDYRKRDVVKVKCVNVPACMFEANSVICVLLCLCLLVSLAFEPILHCFGQAAPDGREMLFIERCEAGDRFLEVYSVFSMCGLLCYFAFIVDLCVYSNRASAFVLSFCRVLPELWLFLLGLAFILLAFSTSTVALKQADDDFKTIERSMQVLLRAFLRMMSCEFYMHLQTFPFLATAITAFVFMTTICMVNVLIAQLAASYRRTYADMIGWARLKRGSVCVASMNSVRRVRWERFVESLQLDAPCEFGEGDVGLPGAIQIREPANLNVTTSDTIRRFGGSTSPFEVWPEDEVAEGDETQSKLDRMEHIVKKALKRIEAASSVKRTAAAGSSSGYTSGGLGGASSGSRSTEHSGHDD